MKIPQSLLDVRATIKKVDDDIAAELKSIEAIKLKIDGLKASRKPAADYEKVLAAQHGVDPLPDKAKLKTVAGEVVAKVVANLKGEFGIAAVREASKKADASLTDDAIDAAFTAIIPALKTITAAKGRRIGVYTNKPEKAAK